MMGDVVSLFYAVGRWISTKGISKGDDLSKYNEYYLTFLLYHFCENPATNYDREALRNIFMMEKID